MKNYLFLKKMVLLFLRDYTRSSSATKIKNLISTLLYFIIARLMIIIKG
jgi:hypothetical protein